MSQTRYQQVIRLRQYHAFVYEPKKALKAYGLTARAVMSSNRDMRHIRHMWLQKMQMKYQDTFEKETEGNTEYSQISFYVSNLDKEMRDEKSLFTLLGVFAYGLIVVIALIGITKYHQYLKHRNGA